MTKMTKKVLIILIALLSVLLCIFIYHKYNRYLPTLDASIQVASLSEQEIATIRRTTPITHLDVHKAKRIVQLMHQEQIIRTYPMRLGFDPIGHKVKEGDGKTPEGEYSLDWRNPKSAFYKSFHVSYPNAQDQATAKSLGVSAGGDIMIHGSATTSQVEKLPSMMDYLPRNDWTWGCIAVRNVDIDEMWKLVDDHTRIRIYP